MLPTAFQLAPITKTSGQLKIVELTESQRRHRHRVCYRRRPRRGTYFRFIYRFSICTKPVTRLWLSENTPEAIRMALKAMKPASAYDALDQAVKRHPAVRIDGATDVGHGLKPL